MHHMVLAEQELSARQKVSSKMSSPLENSGTKPKPKPSPGPSAGPKVRTSANDNSSVNPVFGKIAQSKPDWESWNGVMDAIAEGDFSSHDARLKAIKEGAKAALKYGVAKNEKDAIARSQGNLRQDVLKPKKK